MILITREAVAKKLKSIWERIYLEGSQEIGLNKVSDFKDKFKIQANKDPHGNNRRKCVISISMKINYMLFVCINWKKNAKIPNKKHFLRFCHDSCRMS